MMPREKVDVSIRVTLACARCSREIVRYEMLDGASLTTGNHTQQASYHLKCMREHVLDEAQKRLWSDADDGCVCVHCSAEAADPKEPR